MPVEGPIYRQLNETLRELLRTGEFEDRDRFLTERDVASRFGISRITANKALANLVAERRVEFRRGIGTFVRRGALDYNLRSLNSFTALVESHGRVAETQVLAFERHQRGVPELGGKPTIYVERLRLADGQPVILERRHFLSQFCPGLRKSDLGGSIYKLWQERYFLVIAGAEQTIRAVNARGREAELLQTKIGAAGLLNTSTEFLDGRQPLWHEQALYRGDSYEFFNRLGFVEAPGGAVGRLI